MFSLFACLYIGNGNITQNFACNNILHKLFSGEVSSGVINKISYKYKVAKQVSRTMGHSWQKAEILVTFGYNSMAF